MSQAVRRGVLRRVRCVRGQVDRGSLSLIMVVLMVGLMAMAGLVLDGGRAIAARQSAASIAQEAARAGADALSPDSLRTAVDSRLATDPAAARSAVQHTVSAAGATYTMSITGDWVQVTVTVHEHAIILSAVGVNDLSGTASARAQPLVGSSTGGT